MFYIIFDFLKNKKTEAENQHCEISADLRRYTKFPCAFENYLLLRASRGLKTQIRAVLIDSTF